VIRIVYFPHQTEDLIARTQRSRIALHWKLTIFWSIILAHKR